MYCELMSISIVAVYKRGDNLCVCMHASCCTGMQSMQLCSAICVSVYTRPVVQACSLCNCVVQFVCLYTRVLLYRHAV
jgi:hypothetical protein